MTDRDQEEVENMHAAFRDICEGHSHDLVLLAIGYLLADATDQEFFSEELSLNQRIDNLMEAMKGIVVRLVGAE